MTTEMNTPPRNLWKSAGAILLGFLAVFVLSMGTDEIFHLLKVYPPWTESMQDPKLYALALLYRLLYDVYGSYLMARLAPRNPMRHALIGGWIGLVVSLVGLVPTLKYHMGPAWYPLTLAFSTLPTAWIGGTIFVRRQNI